MAGSLGEFASAVRALIVEERKAIELRLGGAHRLRDRLDPARRGLLELLAGRP